MSRGGDALFAGAIPEIYDHLLVPLLFAPYAADLARRTAARHPGRVLELAAGTGVVTRQLATRLAPEVALVATDLNAAMLTQAVTAGTARPVAWCRADAQAVPFAEASFDVVVCQFGVMFFPDKPRAFAEARRVLRPGGQFLFNVWDRLEQNAFAAAVTQAMATRFPADPPQFLARVPHGYHDVTVIAQDLARGGFTRSPQITTLALQSQARSPEIPARAYCQGTPLRSEIAARDPAGVAAATARATAAIARQFGPGPVAGPMQAHIVAIDKDLTAPHQSRP
jgi:SAM-dependent methyltransferase